MSVTSDLALISLVGRNVARDPAICARALSALSERDLRMIFHGASDMHLSLVVADEDANEVVRSLHRAFFAIEPEEQRLSRPLPVPHALADEVCKQVEV